MPDRTVRAGILTSDKVNELSWPAEVFYRRLMSVVDDYGRYDGRLSILRAALYPLKLNSVRESDVGTWMRECADTGLVRQYYVEQKPFIEIVNFGQRLRAAKSKWPAPSSDNSHSPPSADICQQVPASRGQPLTNAPESESESESEASTHARAPDSPLARIEAIERLIVAEYKLASTMDQTLDGRIKRQAGLINADGGTELELAHFLSQRHKLPNLNFLASDYREWRTNQTRVITQSGAETATHYADGREKPKHMQGFVC